MLRNPLFSDRAIVIAAKPLETRSVMGSPFGWSKAYGSTTRIEGNKSEDNEIFFE